MPEKPEVIRSAESDPIVARIHTLALQIEALAADLETEKLNLLLLRAPAEIADKIRTRVELTEADRVTLAAAVAGKYGDAENRVCSVVVPTDKSKTVDLYPKEKLKEWLTEQGVKKSSPKLLREFSAERVELAREMTGDGFVLLFDRFEVFEPCKSFHDVLERVFAKSPAKRKEILAEFELEAAPQSPHVKIEKPKKSDE